jgi:protein-tyrosine phosphatase
MPRPRGGDWLEDEIRNWRQAGIDVVVSLLTRDEIAELSLADEEELCQAQGIRFLSFPIPDRGIPSSKAAVAELAMRLGESLTAGKNIVIHCRQGIGRSALIAVYLLIRSGMDLETAIQRVSAARGCPVPETSEQRRWLATLAKDVVAPLPR